MSYSDLTGMTSVFYKKMTQYNSTGSISFPLIGDVPFPPRPHLLKPTSASKLQASACDILSETNTIIAYAIDRPKLHVS